MNQTKAKILIVGASGFVGAAIVRAAQARYDMTPIACMRRPSPELDSIGVETRICDASDPIALASALQGVTYAVNSVLGSPATMLSATHNICEAARNSGLQRIVHLSSMAVYGPANGVVDETATCLRPVGAYARAKVRCEAAVRDFVASGGDAVVIRPGCVYGPGGEQWVGRMARWLRAGRVGDLGNPADGYCNLTFNDDLARAVLAALTTPEAGGEIFNVADLDPGTWNQYFLHLGRAIGVHVGRISWLRINLEASILAPPLQIAKLAMRRAGMDPTLIPAPIPPSLLRLWRQKIRLDSGKADALLAFPRTPPEQGLARSAEWFRTVAINH